MALSKPEWFKIRLPKSKGYSQVASILRRYHLVTICQEARCPNRSTCWSSGTATFLILGSCCTRHCAFCAVEKGKPLPPDPDEPARVAEVVAALRIPYVVITSVTRDDLTDGGSAAFAATVKMIRHLSPETQVEVLIPDFQGSREALQTLLAARPDVIGHNLEAPASLYPRLGRKRDNYFRSLELLQAAKQAGFITKSGLMVGLGESRQDIRESFYDLISVGCNLLVIGHYLQPTKRQLQVEKYYSPEEFSGLEEEARHLGFLEVVAGPLVRSSYLAHQVFLKAKTCAT